MAGQAGLGWLSRAQSIPAGFLVGAGVLAAGLPVVWRLRAAGDASDRLDASPARRKAVCAAQGTPPIGQLDAR